MKFCYRICCMFIFCYANVASSQTHLQPVFKAIPLGIRGGIDESNLSAYLLAVAGTENYICLDAGTLHYGIEKAVASNLFKDSASTVLKNFVKGYLISHPHLDHIAGLIINSPDDSPKNIYALPHCITVLKEKYFTWESWANFADDGEKPTLNKYHYDILTEGKETIIEHTSFSVRAFALSHGNPYQSTAFLINHKENYLLYLGDTGADSLEKVNNLQSLWKVIAPLIRTKKLKAIFIEVSYPNEQPYHQLFGHLTPALLMQEMNTLANITGIDAIAGLPVIITHMKPSGSHEATIKKQLTASNRFHLNIIFPEQGKLLKF